MRDPARIDPFLAKLGEYWKLVPDWRFGQLICNVFGEMSAKVDPFFPEEKEMLKYFERFFNPEKEAENDDIPAS